MADDTELTREKLSKIDAEQRNYGLASGRNGLLAMVSNVNKISEAVE